MNLEIEEIKTNKKKGLREAAADERIKINLDLDGAEYAEICEALRICIDAEFQKDLEGAETLFTLLDSEIPKNSDACRYYDWL